ncbi:mutator family transposase [Achromobacter sp. SLBN-14]|nr:mutator family transposase [Achromobacter sp. SLBN-14]
MARTPKSAKQSSKPALPASAEQLLDELVAGPMTAEAVQDTFMLLKKALIERALGAELVQNKAVYLALGVLPDGSREILGLWIETTEGAKFWMRVFNDLKTRGVQDILIAVTDGLKGMPQALEVVFPATTLQTCIVHLIRNSLSYAGWKERRAVAAALRPIYAAVNAQAAQQALDEFALSPWGLKYPMIVKASSATERLRLALMKACSGSHTVG